MNLTTHLTAFAVAVSALTTVSTAFAAGEVALVDVRSSQCPPVSGCYRDTYLRGIVEVQNLGYQKAINIVYKDTYNGSWNNGSASYAGPSTNGNELWSFDLPVAATQFAVSYTVNGQTYWDNNGGADYSVSPYVADALLTYPVIAGAEGDRLSGTTVTGSILLKDLSYNKTVRVVYTDDGWSTTKQGYATYQWSYPSGVQSWIFSVPVAASAAESKIELAFQYTFDGGTAWDNDYGHNYHVVSSLISR